MWASENAALKRDIQAKDTELREAWKIGDRFEALAVERKAEIDRMLREAAERRQEMEAAGQRQQSLSNDVSRLQAQMVSERQAAQEKIEMLTKVRQDMESKFRELAQEALKVQGEAFSKANVEKLTATLTPLKEHVGHFEKELKQVYKATIDDRAALKAEIQALSKRSEEISQEAVSLTRALNRTSNVRVLGAR